MNVLYLWMLLFLIYTPVMFIKNLFLKVQIELLPFKKCEICINYIYYDIIHAKDYLDTM